MLCWLALPLSLELQFVVANYRPIQNRGNLNLNKSPCNKGAEQIFGYEAEEVIGKKRVSLFSPGLVVLAHVNDWLKEAREKGEFIGETVFVRAKHRPFLGICSS